jgi:hypothetical protein
MKILAVKQLSDLLQIKVKTLYQWAELGVDSMHQGEIANQIQT